MNTMIEKILKAAERNAPYLHGNRPIFECFSGPGGEGFTVRYLSDTFTAATIEVMLYPKSDYCRVTMKVDASDRLDALDASRYALLVSVAANCVAYIQNHVNNL